MKIFTKIVCFCFLPFMLIALVLYLAGVREPIAFDSTYYNFMQHVNLVFNDVKFDIPNIPNIPSVDNVGGGWDILNVVINFFNGVIAVINVLILIINKIIEIITFAVILIKEVITFKDTLIATRLNANAFASALIPIN